MLDAILKHSPKKDIDWQFIQKSLDHGLEKFLRFWIFCAIIAPILIVFKFGYSQETTRMIIVGFFIGIGIIAHLIRLLFAQDRLVWRSSLVSKLSIILLSIAGLVLIFNHGFFAEDLMSSTGPLAWIIAILFLLFILQVYSVIARDPSTFAKSAGLPRNDKINILIIIYLILAFYPAIMQYIRKEQTIPSSAGVARFFPSDSKIIIFGNGLGKGMISFWQGAEMVDINSVSSFPGFKSAYPQILWDGGLALLVAFISVFLGLGIFGLILSGSNLRRLGPNSSERARYIRLRILSAGLIFILCLLIFVPFSFMILLLLSILCFRVSENFETREKSLISRKVINFRPGKILIILRILLIIVIIGFILWIIFAIKEVRARALYVSSFSSDNQGFIMDSEKIARAINLSPIPSQYKQGRLLFSLESIKSNITGLNKQSALFDIAKQDALFLEQSNLSGFSAWRLAQAMSSLSSSLFWIQEAEKFYSIAIEKLPYNIILLTETARFYRLLSPTQSPGSSQDKAEELLSRAIAQDGKFAPALLEKAEIALLKDNPKQAHELVKDFESEDAQTSWKLGSIAFRASEIESAEKRFLAALVQNPNHMQARFDLAQVYIALGRNQEARSELDKLESLVAEDDGQTREVISELREMIK